MEAKFGISQTIKAMDFEHTNEYYIVGEIKKIEVVPNRGYLAYHIDITEDSMANDKRTRVGDVGYVPVECMFDFDGRVTLVEDEETDAQKIDRLEFENANLEARLKSISSLLEGIKALAEEV